MPVGIKSASNVGMKSVANSPVVAKAQRLRYLDGLKLVAAVILFNSSFFEVVIPVADTTFNIDNPGYFLRNSSWAIAVFFIVTGRSLTLSFWKPYKTANGKKVAQFDWFTHAASYFTRVFRFVLPAFFVSLLQWQVQLCENGYFDVAQEARNAVMAGTLMSKPSWCSIQRFLQKFAIWFLAHINDIGKLIPYEASYFTYFTAAMFTMLPTNRVVLYIFLLILSWVTYGYHFVALLGLAIADLNVSGLFRWFHKKAPKALVLLQILYGSLGLLIALYRPLANIIDQASSLQRTNMSQIRMLDALSAFLSFSFCSLSRHQRRFSGFCHSACSALWAACRLEFRPYICLILNSIVPRTAMVAGGKLDESFVPKAYFTVLAATIATAITFYFVIEQPSITIGRWLWRFFTSPNSPLEEVKMIPSLIIAGYRRRIHRLHLRRSLSLSDDDFDDFLSDEGHFEIVEDKLKKEHVETLVASATAERLSSCLKDDSHGKDDDSKSHPTSEATLYNSINDNIIALPSIADKNQEIKKIASPPGQNAPSTKRLDYLDGIRGIAMLMVFNSHFIYHTFYNPHPDVIPVDTFQFVIRHGQFALGLFFVLSGRVMLLSFFRKRLKTDQAKYLTLSAGNYRRFFRLGMPVAITAFLQWQVCIQGHTNVARDAEAYLKSGVLNIPYWCRVQTFSNYVEFLMDIFTSTNHQVILDGGSTLWTIYIQFWGSIYAYAISMIVVHSARRRNLFCCFLIICGIYTHNYDCDWDASGALKATKKWKWWKVFILELFLVTTAFTILSFWQISHGLNDFFAEFTIKNGALHKFDPEHLFTMFPGWFIPAVCVLLWIEISPVTQWFISSKIFRIFGKVSFGFYLLHMTLIYSVMPRLVLSLKDQYSYWNVIIISYITILIMNYCLSYIFFHTIEEWSGKIARRTWDFLFISGKTEISYLPIKLVKTLKSVVLSMPTTISGYVSEKIKGFRKPFQKSEGTPIRPPHDHDLVEDIDPSDLHSTYWETDLHHDRVAMRTAFVLRMNSFLAPFHFIGILGLGIMWFMLNPVGPWDGQKVLSFATGFCPSPTVIITLVGFSVPRIAYKKEEMDKNPVQRDLNRNFYIVIVTKGCNHDAVRRRYSSMLPLEKLHPVVKVVVLTNEPFSYPDLNNVVCPSNYQSDKGIAKHKARAEYFRQHAQILHMDEESTIDAESLRRCFDFNRYEKHHFGQGVILYNAYNYWSNWFFTVADAIRVGDDLARFNLQYTIFQRPVFGAHGSFLMTNGHLENLVTWNFGTLAEDFELSHTYLGSLVERFTVLSESNHQLVYLGIRDIQGLYHLPQIAIKLWSTGVFCLIATVINIPFSFLVDGSPVHQAFALECFTGYTYGDWYFKILIMVLHGIA
ncbi:acyltransferase family-domain-containing protein [Paraphysoderma sedebokerense]|nr:acyltransferase family-domain-containing protein [Paraphysoderma sedebokerense]